MLLKFKLKIILFFINLNIINITKIIKIDNLINEVVYQNELNFSQYKTNHKILAIYYPDNNNKSIYKKEFQLLPDKKEEINIYRTFVNKQIEIAKNHGIFGFGIVYNLIKENNFNEAIIDSFIRNLDNYPFFIIFNNKDYKQKNSSFLNKKKNTNENDFMFFIEKIKKYIILENYIKIEGKPILGTYNSTISFQIFNYTDKEESGKSKNYNSLILQIPLENITLEFLKETESIFYLNKKNFRVNNSLRLKYFYNLYNDEYVKSKHIKIIFTLNGSHPEKFFLILKKLLNYTNPEKDILIVNAWNDFYNNLFISPQKEFGFLYLNYLSKAIFNLDNNAENNIKYLKNETKVAVQVHLFYLDLIEDIINKTNNIPVKFDMYMSTIYKEKYEYIKNYINKFSKANHFEILIVKNKGRDVLPFLTQMKTKYRFYKYLCHIHTKKTKYNPKTGFQWRNYLHNNLLGDKKIVSDIIFDFEKNKKLGFIFPETYIEIVKFTLVLFNKTKSWMEFLASKLLPNCKLGEFLDFPAGNMFWSKTAAIYQIFTHDLDKYFPNERAQKSFTIMHGIERIWLYIVKFNYFKYKIIFKSF